LEDCFLLARLLLNSAADHDLVQPASIAWRNVAEHPRVRNNLKQAINASEESERVYFHEGDILVGARWRQRRLRD
jgi:hypothetical protein